MKTGTIHELADKWVETFKKQTPEEQEQMRKEIYEEMTGKPYRAKS